MDISSMDMTSVCDTLDAHKKEVLSLQDKNEALTQETYGLRKRIDLLEKVNSEFEQEITALSTKKDNETVLQKNLKVELDNAHIKINQLESLLEEEKINYQLLKEKETRNESKNYKTVVLPDQEQLNILTGQIQATQFKLDNINEEKICLLEEKSSYLQQIHQLKCENQALQDEVSEIKQLLNQKSEDFRNCNQILESTREEKLLLSTELSMLKTSDTNAARGNSLFAEVEENRQKMAAEREILKLKYAKIKNCLAQQMSENNKLKMEIIKMRRNEQDDENSVHRDYNDLLATYKQKTLELESRVKALEEENPDKPPIPNKDGENANYQWVNTVVEEARKKSRDLQKELDFRGTNYVIQGHKLFDSQKQNRKLKNTLAKMQSDIDELKLKLETSKTAQEDLKDGISPPVLEEVTKYKKLKAVTFKEALHDRSNISAGSGNDTSGDDLNKSTEKNFVYDDIKSEQGSDKENLLLTL